MAFILSWRAASGDDSYLYAFYQTQTGRKKEKFQKKVQDKDNEKREFGFCRICGIIANRINKPQYISYMIITKVK